jgi:Tfp pilus assembly protein PilV
MCMRFRRRIAISPAESGFALIEVLVSAVIAVIAAAGVMQLMQSSIRTATDQRARSQSYAVAQEDQARMRAMRIPSLRNYEAERTVTVGNVEYTVKSTGKFVNDSAENVTCGSGKSTEDYVKIGTEVTWPNMSPIKPTLMHGIIAPPSNSLNPSTGTLVIEARNSRNVALNGIGVSGSGPGTFTGSTSSGCAVFLEQTAGLYTLKVSGGSTGVVDVDGNTLPSEQPLTVNPQTTTTVELLLDTPGSVPINFVVNNYESKTQAAKPGNVIVYNSGMTTAKSFAVTTSSKTFTGLFPFESADSFYTGTCTESAPTSGSIGIVNVAVPVNASAATQTLTMPALLLNVTKNGSATGANGAKVYVSTEECGASTREYTTATVSSREGRLTAPELPWGTYSVCAYIGISEKVNNVTTTVYHEDSLTPFDVKTAKTEKTLDISSSDPKGKCE